MRLVLMAILLAITLQASEANKSLGVTFGGMSSHKQEGFNESHKWIGINYSFYTNNNHQLAVEYANFDNSYANNTNMLMLQYNYTIADYKELSIGTVISAGIQKGYCHHGFNTIPCTESSNDITPLILPSIRLAYSDISIDISIVPNVVTMARIKYTLIKW